MIDKKEIKNLADLCKLDLTQDEKTGFLKELNTLLDEVKSIKDIETKDVEITYNVNGMLNDLRKEEVHKSLSREEALKNTSEEQYGYFKILKVMD